MGIFEGQGGGQIPQETLMHIFSDLDRSPSWSLQP